MKSISSRQYRFLTAILQLVIAFAAIPTGLLYSIAPDGHLMGNTTALLQQSPFSSFLIPGLFLLVVIGIGNLIGAVLSLRHRRIAAQFAISTGAILVLWILLQIYWIGLGSILQPLFFLVGFAEALFGFLQFQNETRGNEE